MAENVEVAAMSAHRIGRAEAQKRAQNALELMGIGHLPAFPAMLLPQGEERAAEMGANAVVGVDLDYEVLGQSGSMLMVSVSGTAVQV